MPGSLASTFARQAVTCGVQPDVVLFGVDVVAIPETRLDTIVGPVDWSNGPINNVTKTPLVAGQWQKEGEGFDLKIVANSAARDIPLTGEMKLL